MIDIILVVFLFAIFTAGIVLVKDQAEKRNALNTIPAPALSKSDVPLANRLTHYYQLAQRSVRILEHLQSDYTVSPMISPEDKTVINKLINEFYEEKT